MVRKAPALTGGAGCGFDCRQKNIWRGSRFSKENLGFPNLQCGTLIRDRDGFQCGAGGVGGQVGIRDLDERQGGRQTRQPRYWSHFTSLFTYLMALKQKETTCVCINSYLLSLMAQGVLDELILFRFSTCNSALPHRQKVGCPSIGDGWPGHR